MKYTLSSATIAAALLFGGHGIASAQAVDPAQPGSAAGGVQAQATQPGQGGPGSAGQQGQAGQAGAAQAGRMSEDQIRNALRARGYSEISGLDRDGDTFRVREAKRHGEKVENLRIDARTGQVRDEPRLTEDQARNMLRDQGYSEVRDVSRDGNAITARAKRGDNEVRLRIDANTGVVTQQQASN
jgi:hypothetical protein